MQRHPRRKATFQCWGDFFRWNTRDDRGEMLRNFWSDGGSRDKRNVDTPRASRAEGPSTPQCDAAAVGESASGEAAQHVQETWQLEDGASWHPCVTEDFGSIHRCTNARAVDR